MFKFPSLMIITINKFELIVQYLFLEGSVSCFELSVLFPDNIGSGL